MSKKFAVDFGTTNTLVAKWQDGIHLLKLPHLSIDDDSLPLIPSLVYIDSTELVCGHTVQQRNLDYQQNNRLFKNFKRDLLAVPPPPAREIAGQKWDYQMVASHFMQTILSHIATPEIEKLVITVPVSAFENYVRWLSDIALQHNIPLDKIHIVDESTAAALGYAVQEAGAPVLVVDFGGGTLDLSLVRLPEERVKTGGGLGFLRRNKTENHAAEVIAKAGQPLGGSDIDQWLLHYALDQWEIDHTLLGNAYVPVLSACEEAKINLTTREATTINTVLNNHARELTITRADLNQILLDNGLFASLRRTLDNVMTVARQRNILKEDIRHVLMVGGTSLIPAIQEQLQDYFSELAVRTDKPFTAVVEGALQLTVGFGLQDYLSHTYALRWLDENGEHQWEEIIPMGTEYPSEPTEIILQVAHNQQTAVEMVIGEIDTNAISMIETRYEGDQVVFVGQPNNSAQHIAAINAEHPPLAKLNSPADLNQDRFRAKFYVDEHRQLRLTLDDMHTKKTLLDNIVVATLQ